MDTYEETIKKLRAISILYQKDQSTKHKFMKTTKRKRGRPRKVVVTEPQPKRGRGRPPFKVKTIEIEGNWKMTHPGRLDPLVDIQGKPFLRTVEEVLLSAYAKKRVEETKETPYPIVYIEWDSTDQRLQELSNIVAVDFLKTIAISSVGFLVFKDEKKTIIAQTNNNGEGSSFLVIPTGCIRVISTLSVLK